MSKPAPAGLFSLANIVSLESYVEMFGVTPLCFA
jgi:hypothetical protein